MSIVTRDTPGPNAAASGALSPVWGTSDEERSDERLLAAIHRGDERAFEVVYDRHHRVLLSFCRHMLGSQEEAEDALQQVFVSAHRQLTRELRPVQLRPWLFTIARNRCLSMIRARRETVPLDRVAQQPVTDGLAVASVVEQRSDLRAMLEDLGKLPEEQRAALVLAEIEDLSHDEIAHALEVRKAKVAALIFQARETLGGWRAAREADCRPMREQLASLRGSALRRAPLRRHVAVCAGCAAFEAEVKHQRAAFALLLPVVPTVALKENVLSAAFSTAQAAAGIGGAAAVGGATGSGGAATGVGAAKGGGAGGTGAGTTGAGGTSAGTSGAGAGAGGTSGVGAGASGTSGVGAGATGTSAAGAGAGGTSLAGAGATGTAGAAGAGAGAAGGAGAVAGAGAAAGGAGLGVAALGGAGAGGGVALGGAAAGAGAGGLAASSVAGAGAGVAGITSAAGAGAGAAAVTAGAGAGAVAAAGAGAGVVGTSAVAATGTGLAAKILAVAAIAGGTVGGGAVVTRDADPPDVRPAAATAPGTPTRGAATSPISSTGAAGGGTTTAAGDPAGRGSGRRALEDPRGAVDGAAKGVGKAGDGERGAGKGKDPKESKESKDPKDSVPGSVGPVRTDGRGRDKTVPRARGKVEKKVPGAVVPGDSPVEDPAVPDPGSGVPAPTGSDPVPGAGVPAPSVPSPVPQVPVPSVAPVPTVDPRGGPKPGRGYDKPPGGIVPDLPVDPGKIKPVPPGQAKKSP